MIQYYVVKMFVQGECEPNRQLLRGKLQICVDGGETSAILQVWGKENHRERGLKYIQNEECWTRLVI